LRSSTRSPPGASDATLIPVTRASHWTARECFNSPCSSSSPAGLARLLRNLRPNALVPLRAQPDLAVEAVPATAQSLAAVPSDKMTLKLLPATPGRFPSLSSSTCLARRAHRPQHHPYDLAGQSPRIPPEALPALPVCRLRSPRALLSPGPAALARACVTASDRAWVACCRRAFLILEYFQPCFSEPLLIFRVRASAAAISARAFSIAPSVGCGVPPETRISGLWTRNVYKPQSNAAG